MIINKLKMASFGAYLKPVEIDFNNINNRGIFLLTGPTGVGKTTIFDAICYALYGQTSSQVNCLDRIRSDYASENDETYVSLDFTVNGVEYHITRKPEQLLKGKKDKVIKRAPSVLFSYSDVLFDKIKVVDEEIKKIIGLDINQFRQIVMIPQGEFIRLLTAKSEDKVEIFRHIFKTDIIYGFQNILNEKLKAAQQKNQDILNIIDANLTVLNIEKSDKELDILIEEEEKRLDDERKELIKQEDVLNSTFISLKKKKEIIDNQNKINKLIASCLVEKENLSLLLSNDISSLREINKNYEWAKKLNDITVLIEDSEKKIIRYDLDLKEEKELLNGFIEKKKEYNNQKQILESKKDLIDKMKIRNEEIDKTIKQNAVFLKKKKELEDIRGDIKKIDAEKYDKELEIKNKDLLIISEDIKKREEEDNRFSDFTLNVEREKAYFDDLCENRKIFLDDLLYRQKLEENKEKENKALLDYYKAKEEAAKIGQFNISNKAYFLACELKDSLPCPVCGSTHHPSPAQKQNDITDQDLEKYLLVENDKKLEYEKVKIEEANIIIEIEKNLSNVNLSSNKDNYNTLYEEQKKKLDELDEKKQEFLKNELILKGQRIKYHQVLEEIEKIKINKEEAKKKINALYVLEATIIGELKDFKEENIEGLTALKKDNEKSIDEYNDDVKKIDKLMIDNALNEASSIEKIKNFEKNILDKKLTIENSRKEYDLLSGGKEYKIYLVDNISEVRDKINQYDNEVSATKALIERYEKEIDGGKEVDVSLLETAYEKDNQRYFDDYKKWSSSKSLLENREKICLNIKNLSHQHKNEFTKYEQISRLANMANGKNAKHLSFEKYLLSVYFDDILENANYVLSDLTNGRYKMIRSDVVSRGQAGLDIAIYDYNSGYIRDVKTLSGGESFKAALALALGLSNVISMHSSLVDIKMMFIDEGFGSLDSESLDQALNVLSKVKTDGRIIGVISHVEELKNRIDAKIILKSTEYGSIVESIIY